MNWVMISYDLADPPGGNNEFKAYMESAGWSYKFQDGSPYPRSTCTKQIGGTPEQAYAAGNAELANARQYASTQLGRQVVIERKLIASFPASQGVLKG